MDQPFEMGGQMNRAVFVETQNVLNFGRAMTVLTDMETGYPGLGLVWGQAGRGKTECAKTYASRADAVYYRVEEDMTPRAMLAALCRELVGAEHFSTDGCKRMACDSLESRRRPVIVDEADRLRVNLLEHWRDIHDKTGAPIVFVGEEPLFSKIYSRRRIYSRVAQAVEFTPIGTEDIMTLAMRACHGVSGVDPDAAAKLLARCEGDFRPVIIDLIDLERTCKASGKSVITAKMVATLPDRRANVPKLRGARHA